MAIYPSYQSLIGVFNPFIFDVITNKVGFIPAIFLFYVLLSYVFFVPLLPHYCLLLCLIFSSVPFKFSCHFFYCIFLVVFLVVPLSIKFKILTYNNLL